MSSVMELMSAMLIGTLHATSSSLDLQPLIKHGMGDQPLISRTGWLTCQCVQPAADKRASAAAACLTSRLSVWHLSGPCPSSSFRAWSPGSASSLTGTGGRGRATRSCTTSLLPTSLATPILVGFSMPTGMLHLRAAL